MADLQELGGAVAGERGVGEEDLVPQALVLVEQGQLGAGVRSLAAHDDAGAGRVAGKVDHAGQLGDLGAVTQGAVLVQGGVPDLLGQGPDRAADRLGDRVSDREEGADSSCSAASRTWARKAFADPALSVRTRMSVPCRWASGICASASSSTAM